MPTLKQVSPKPVVFADPKQGSPAVAPAVRFAPAPGSYAAAVVGQAASSPDLAAQIQSAVAAAVAPAVAAAIASLSQTMTKVNEQLSQILETFNKQARSAAEAQSNLEDRLRKTETHMTSFSEFMSLHASASLAVPSSAGAGTEHSSPDRRRKGTNARPDGASPAKKKHHTGKSSDSDSDSEMNLPAAPPVSVFSAASASSGPPVLPFTLPSRSSPSESPMPAPASLSALPGSHAQPVGPPLPPKPAGSTSSQGIRQLAAASASGPAGSKATRNLAASLSSPSLIASLSPPPGNAAY